MPSLMHPVISDRQQNRVYSWERREIAPWDRTLVQFHHIPHIVSHVWHGEGINFPPLVAKLVGQPKNVLADATRTCVRFRDTTYTWIVLHELAHSMTSLCDGRSNYHGSLFMGMYCKLVAKYMGRPLDKLLASARMSGLEVAEDAKPVFH